MRLTIFGATGRTGRHVVEQALAAGHEVTALVRDPAKVPVLHARLRLVKGSIHEPGQVEGAVAGADAVISTLGPRSNALVFEISRGMEVILDAMNKHGVRRLVMSCGMAIRAPQDRPGALDRVIGGLLSLTARNVAEDMRRAVAAVQASDLDWTVLRTPRLTDKPGGSALQYGYAGGGLGFQLARADYARALLDAATQGRFVHEMPAVSN